MNVEEKLGGERAERVEAERERERESKRREWK